jgi:MFS family permease
MTAPFLHPDDSYVKPPRIDVFTFYYGVLNFIIPGLGTIIGAMTEHYGRKNGKQVLVGIIQFWLGFLFIGWIWSVIWGMIMIATCSGHG